MPQDTKLLSDVQLEVLHNTGFFDTKREITEVIYRHFHDLISNLSEAWNATPLKESYASPAAKIFKGENYKGYPYVNLDYPRLFHAKEVFAFRTMMWWGKHFSFTLHLQGKAWEREKDRLMTSIRTLRKKDYYVCVNSTPWEYHYGPENYTRLDEIPDEELAGKLNNGFIKLSRKLELDEYSKLVSFGTETFREILSCLD